MVGTSRQGKSSIRAEGTQMFKRPNLNPDNAGIPEGKVVLSGCPTKKIERGPATLKLGEA